MRVAVVGCGGIGNRRAQAIRNLEAAELVCGIDLDEAAAERFGEKYGVEWGTDWRWAADRPDVDLVIISTANSAHAETSIGCLEAGKHVICEKPLARNPVECQAMVEAAQRAGKKLKTGFNHRYSHQTWKAHELLQQGAIGEIIFIRGRTGHGAGEQLAERWFGNFELSGGGTFLDNGVHLLDLARWFMGEFVEAVGYKTTHIPKLGQCEDNGFGLYKTTDGRVCALQSSWTQWRGYLMMEIFGTQGELIINYDESSCTLVRRGAETTAWSFAGIPDRSWEREIEEMMAAVREDREPLANGHDGMRAVQMAYAVYESAESGQTVKV
jgi:predicted dehydrogenase